MKREKKDVPNNSLTPHLSRVFHQCLPIAASRARLRALLCYVMLCYSLARSPPERPDRQTPRPGLVPTLSHRRPAFTHRFLLPRKEKHTRKNTGKAILLRGSALVLRTNAAAGVRETQIAGHANGNAAGP